MKYLLVAGLLLLSLPFWLPRAMGGDTSFHFVLTPSMKGSVDPGSFVVLRHADTYEVGEVVGYRRDLGGNSSITVLHRIVGRLPDGRFLVKGDAVSSTDEVKEEDITGRMVLAVPGLGFLPGAFRQFPLLVGGLSLALFFVAGGVGKAATAGAASASGLFGTALLAVALTFPFATLGLVAILGKLPTYGLLLAFLGVTRYVEVRGVNHHALPLAELNYLLALFMAVSGVSLPVVVESLKTGLKILS